MGIYYKGDLTFKTRKSIMHFKKHVHLDPKDNHHSSWYDSHDKQAVRHATTWYDNELRGNSTSTSSGRWNPDEIQLKWGYNHIWKISQFELFVSKLKGSPLVMKIFLSEIVLACITLFWF